VDRDRIAASTRWVETPLSLDRLRRILELGFQHLSVHEEIRERDLEGMLEFLPPESVISTPLLAPLPNTVRPGAPPPFRMGSLHPEERRDALGQGMRALEIADSAGIPFILVPPGELEDPPRERVMELWNRGGTDFAWQALRKQREEAARRQLDSYLSTLAPILDRADRYSVELALSPGALPCELPDIAELELCLKEFRGAPLHIWVSVSGEARYRRSGGAGADRLRCELKSLVRALVLDLYGGNEIDLENLGVFREGPPRTGNGQEGGGETTGTPGKGAGRIWILDLASGAPEDELLQSRENIENFLFPPEMPPPGPLGF